MAARRQAERATAEVPRATVERAAGPGAAATQAAGTRGAERRIPVTVRRRAIPTAAATCPPERRSRTRRRPITSSATARPGAARAQAFVDAVAQGGVITFDCGPEPVTITLDATGEDLQRHGAEDRDRRRRQGHAERRRDDAHPLHEHLRRGAGTGRRRTATTRTTRSSPCRTSRSSTATRRARTSTTAAARSACAAGASRSSTRASSTTSATTRARTSAAPRCASSASTRASPVYVVNSTFGGADGFGNTCSNGGGLSSIGVSWTIVNSLFSHNRAIGNGANPGAGGHARRRQRRRHLQRRQHDDALAVRHADRAQRGRTQDGSAIFFVSNDHSGNIVIDDSVIRNNTGGCWYARTRDLDARRHADRGDELDDRVVPLALPLPSSPVWPRRAAPTTARRRTMRRAAEAAPRRAAAPGGPGGSATSGGAGGVLGHGGRGWPGWHLLGRRRQRRHAERLGWRRYRRQRRHPTVCNGKLPLRARGRDGSERRLELGRRAHGASRTRSCAATRHFVARGRLPRVHVRRRR